MWLVVLWEGRCKWGRSLLTLAHAGTHLQHMMDEDLGNCGFCEINKTWTKRWVWCRLWGRSLPRSGDEVRRSVSIALCFIWSNIKASQKHQNFSEAFYCLREWRGVTLRMRPATAEDLNSEEATPATGKWCQERNDGELPADDRVNRRFSGTLQ